MNIALVPAPVAARQNNYSCSKNMVDVLRPDLPVLCFSPTKLKAQADLFLTQFGGETAFAVKSNPDPRVISTLFQSGIRVFDVASPGEMALVTAHAPGAEMHYHNPVKSRDEIAIAYHQYHCRRFAVDDIGELNKIEQVTGKTEGIEIAVRMRLPAAPSSIHDFSTKFGASPVEVIALLRACTERGFSPLVTFHPGSQCHDVQGWVRHIKVAAQVARESGVKLEKLNIGGGFPARYNGGDTPELSTIFDTIDAVICEAFPVDRPRLECEPGRALVAACISLITRVKAVRHGNNEIFLNDGIYGSLMESAQAPALTPQHRLLRTFEANCSEELFTVFGPTCDPLDCLPLPLKLPADLCEGEYIEFEGVGAYGSATSTGFNGYGCASMVIVA